MRRSAESRIGERFGRLVVEDISHRDMNYMAYMICKCDCGKTKKIRLDSLTNGAARSCGCLARENTIERNTKHGDHGTKFYWAWVSMNNRCYGRASSKQYPTYILRTVCDQWKEYLNFKGDMYKSYLDHIDKYGEKNTTLDRKDNSKGYNHNNCRWATYSVQNNNRNT